MIKTLRAVEKAYDDAAPFYDIMNRIYFRGHDQQFRSLLVNALELSPESIILDMCCGTGLDYPFLRQAINQSGTIIGIDLSKQMLRRAQSKGYRDLHLIRGDITQLPFRDHVFDACIITFCLHVTPLFHNSIKEMVRVLNNSGQIGVLANHKPRNFIKLALIQLIGRMAKIEFSHDLEQHFSQAFVLVENALFYGDLVQMLIGKAKKRARAYISRNEVTCRELCSDGCASDSQTFSC